MKISRSATVSVAVAAVVALLAMTGGSQARGQPEVEPGLHPLCDPATGGDERFCPQVAVSLADPAPGAQSDITVSLELLAPQYNFRLIVTFLPPDWEVASDSDIPDGAVTGELTSMSTLGLIGGACNTPVPTGFTFMDATTSADALVPFEEQFAVLDGLPRGVTEYPDYLTRMFVDADLAAITPLSRQYAQTLVGETPVSLNFVLFQPGTPIGPFNPDPAMGYPSVTVLQNTGDPGAEAIPAAITDFCTPLTSETITFGETRDNPDIEGDQGGGAYRTNPGGDGDHQFTTFALSLWDTNRNGLENDLDPCRHRLWDPAEFEWDPREFDDMPPLEACGLDPADTSVDIDQDGFLNRQDNCPWVANAEAPDNQRDTNGDGVGDACYTEDGLDGALEPPRLGAVGYAGCVFSPVPVGAGGAAPAEICDMQFVAPPGDGDGDGAADAADDGGLGTGAIAGIVAGTVAAAAALGGGYFLLSRRRAAAH
ncbi:MAG: hypothetical protein WD379_06955 [Dehalococcoidia bacterium]